MKQGAHPPGEPTGEPTRPLTVIGVCGARLHFQPPGSGGGISSAESQGRMVTELQLGGRFSAASPPFCPLSALCIYRWVTSARTRPYMPLNSQDSQHRDRR